MLKLAHLSKNDLVAVSQINSTSFKSNMIVNPAKHFDFYQVWGENHSNILTKQIHYLDLDVVGGANLYSVNTTDRDGHLLAYYSARTIQEIKDYIEDELL